ncbi:hypothetical protein ECFRIK1999_5826, partial [Escherichia coli FRIK1999]
GQI